MSSYEIAVDKVFWLEGFDAVTEDPDDAGGLTKWGISQRQYPSVDIRALTREDAASIYRNDYWNPLWEQLPQELASELLETCVVMGVHDGVECLQKALVYIGKQVVVDGSFGPKTLAACLQMKEQPLLRWFRVEQIIRAIKIGEAKPAQKKWLRGWISRAIA